MQSKIKLLPENVANQIAAGEVIQRPASVLKELLENSIDAGASRIEVIIEGFGKQLVRVKDNGTGMSVVDARACFERHATSKISKPGDLERITTKGFRGEAMASIAAVARVEMWTRTADKEVGSYIKLENSKLIDQEPAEAAVGTDIHVKDIFYNVPARRKFLKSDRVEMKHLIEEFRKIAFPHHDIEFSLYHQGKLVEKLSPSTRIQRVLTLLGGKYEENLIIVNEETEEAVIEAYIGLPETARKRRGDQYFFLNDRPVKSGYLAHAVRGAYADLIPEGSYPAYVVFINMDPEMYDINVHPSKEEVKFEDERLLYNYLKVCIRHGLGKYHLNTRIDFDEEGSDLTKKMLRQNQHREGLKYTSDHLQQNWESVYQGLKQDDEMQTIPSRANPPELIQSDEEPASLNYKDQYLFRPVEEGLMVINLRSAVRRILYEHFLRSIDKQENDSQRLLFPEMVEFNSAGAHTLESHMELLVSTGFDIRSFGNNSYVINAVPVELSSTAPAGEILEKFIEIVAKGEDPEKDIRKLTAKSLARLHSSDLSEYSETEEIVKKLFECQNPYLGLNGHRAYTILSERDIRKWFK